MLTCFTWPVISPRVISNSIKDITLPYIIKQIQAPRAFISGLFVAITPLVNEFFLKEKIQKEFANLNPQAINLMLDHAFFNFVLPQASSASILGPPCSEKIVIQRVSKIN